MSAKLCPGTGQTLPDDAKSDFEADPTCTHFYCPECAKLLALPAKPDGLIRRHVAAVAPWDPLTPDATEATEATEATKAEQPKQPQGQPA